MGNRTSPSQKLSLSLSPFLGRLNITYPMLFKLTNKNSDRMTHCGVLEFVADEGICYLPHWVSGAAPSLRVRGLVSGLGPHRRATLSVCHGYKDGIQNKALRAGGGRVGGLFFDS